MQRANVGQSAAEEFDPAFLRILQAVVADTVLASGRRSLPVGA
jgi:hypothetical protein